MGSGAPFYQIQPIDARLNTQLSTRPSLEDESGRSSGFMQDEEGKGLTFQSLFAQAVNGVNDSLLSAGDLGRKAMTGEVKNLHEISIAGAKAEIMLKLATQITSKVTQAATQLFQMQI